MVQHGRARLAACATAVCLASAAARANDGGIAFGGSPGLLRAHPTVSMRREVVRITVGEENVTADCRFVFQNDGPACVVRMGFPDRGEGEEDPDEEGPRNPPRGAFTSFRSYVDGRPVATRLIRADRPGRFWHAKTVAFPAHGRRVVRDVYTVRVGSQVTPAGAVLYQTAYVLHTGASWRGPIGRTEVIVTFDRRRMTAPLAPVRVGRGGMDPVWNRDWSRARGRVYYRGPAAPAVRGRTLRFVRDHWRPSADDDIRLYFDERRGGA